MGVTLSLPDASQRQILKWIDEQISIHDRLLRTAKGDDIVRYQQFIEACEVLRVAVEREDREERNRARRAAAVND